MSTCRRTSSSNSFLALEPQDGHPVNSEPNKERSGVVRTPEEKRTLSGLASYKASSFWTTKNPVTITVKDLVYAIPKNELLHGVASRCFKQTTPSRVLLDRVSMIARPGELLVIVGPSGSGKTTLLNALALRTPTGCIIEGHIKYNGRIQSSRRIRSIVNYVMARDVLLCYLTVYETLTSAAELKLPHLSATERLARVETVLTSMELHHCRDMYIGGEWKKGLSTGELKRVSIGIELLDNPSVLILDEPTTGLDGSLSIKLMSCLFQEARKGTTIIVTLHQPCSQVFDMCDQFLLLSDGRVAYHGSPLRAHSYFERIGHCPTKGWNPSDFYLALVSPLMFSANGAAESTVTSGCSQTTVLANWEDSVEKKELDHEIQQTENLLGASSFPLKDGEAPFKCYPSSTRMFALWKRTTRNTLRNPLTCLVVLLIQAMQGLILGGIFYNMNTMGPTKNISPLISETIWTGSSWIDSLGNVSTKHHFYAGLTPFLNVYQHGVDGRGSYVFFNNTENAEDVKQRIHYALDTVTMCLYRKFGLAERGYPKLPEVEKPERTDWKNSSLSPRRAYVHALALYQLIDYWFGTGPRHKGFPIKQLFACDSSNDLSCLLRNTKDHLGDTFECIGLPPLDSLLIQSSASTVGPPSGSGPSVFPPPTPPTASVLALREECRQNLLRIQAKRDSTTGTQRMIWDFLGPEIKSLADGLQMWTCRATGCNEPLCGRLQQLQDWLITWTTDLAQSVSSALNLAGCLFFVTAILGFASYEALLIFPQERPLFNRESANGLYSSFTYYIAKNLADLPFQLLPSLLMATLFYFLAGFDVTLYQFSTYFGLCALTCFSAYGFGYMVSAAAPRMEVAVLVAPLTLVIWLVLAGFFLRDRDIPNWIAWFKYLSFYRWAYFSFITNQFPSGGFFGSLPNDLITRATGVTNGYIFETSFFLFGLGFLYRLLGFIFLAFTNRRVGLEA